MQIERLFEVYIESIRRGEASPLRFGQRAAIRAFSSWAERRGIEIIQTKGDNGPALFCPSCGLYYSRAEANKQTKGAKMKPDIKEKIEKMIEKHDQQHQSTRHLDPQSAEYWKGRADALRDVLAMTTTTGRGKSAEGLKVWGIMSVNADGKQQRCVVAAKTKAKAAKALGCTVFHLGKYGAITGNELHIKLALENPGKAVFVGGV